MTDANAKKAAPEVRPPPGSRAHLKMVKESKDSEGVKAIRALMAAQGKKGQPANHVILSNHDRLWDGERIFGIVSKLPDTLEAGNHVWIFDSRGGLTAVRVLEDRGDTLYVTNEASQFEVARAECYATAVPRRPTVIHRRELAAFIGPALAARWWNPKTGMRVTPPKD